jgi:dTDP-4-amino-4,6-dideoxygalactose transaminase
MALGAKPGGLCVMPSWTFVATAHAAIQAGLTPWFLDVDPVTGVLDADHVRERLAHAPGPVSAVIPVAAFGQPLDPEPWAKLADGHRPAGGHRRGRLVRQRPRGTDADHGQPARHQVAGHRRGRFIASEDAASSIASAP